MKINFQTTLTPEEIKIVLEQTQGTIWISHKLPKLPENAFISFIIKRCVQQLGNKSNQKQSIPSS